MSKRRVLPDGFQARADKAAGTAEVRAGLSTLDAARTLFAVPVPDSKLDIQMLHDRVMVRLVDEDGERRSSGGILIPATAQVAYLVMRERDLQAVASERVEHGTGLYL